jgi:hypothetical protein
MSYLYTGELMKNHPRPKKIEKSKKPSAQTPQVTNFITDISVDRPVEEFEDFTTTPVFTQTINDLPSEEQARRMVENGMSPSQVIFLLGISPMKLATMLKRENDLEFIRELIYEYEKRRSSTCRRTVLQVQPQQHISRRF